MTKYSKEEKIAAIQKVEAGESIAEVSKSHRISESVLRWEVNRYRQHGENEAKIYTYGLSAIQKYEILKYMHENQYSFQETGILLGIRGSTIGIWEKRYLENGMDGLKEKKKGRKPRIPKPKLPKTREEELLDRIQYLEAENAYLKKLNALVAEREKHERENG